MWNFRANIDGVRGYIQRSTKQANLTLAISEAKNGYIELVGRQRQHLTILKTKFDDVFNIWLKEAKKRKTDKRYSYIVGTYNRYLKGHFGNLEVTQLRQKQIDNYWKYRENFYVDGEGKDRLIVNEKRIGSKTKTSNNIKIKPKYGTLRAEASTIHSFACNEFMCLVNSFHKDTLLSPFEQVQSLIIFDIRIYICTNFDIFEAHFSY